MKLSDYKLEKLIDLKYFLELFKVQETDDFVRTYVNPLVLEKSRASFNEFKKIL